MGDNCRRKFDPVREGAVADAVKARALPRLEYEEERAYVAALIDVLARYYARMFMCDVTVEDLRKVFESDGPNQLIALAYPGMSSDGSFYVDVSPAIPGCYLEKLKCAMDGIGYRPNMPPEYNAVFIGYISHIASQLRRAARSGKAAARLRRSPQIRK